MTRFHPPLAPTERTLAEATRALGVLNCPQDDGFLAGRAAIVAGYLREEDDGTCTPLDPVDGTVLRSHGAPVTTETLVRTLLWRRVGPDGRRGLGLGWSAASLVGNV